MMLFNRITYELRRRELRRRADPNRYTDLLYADDVTARVVGNSPEEVCAAAAANAADVEAVIGGCDLRLDTVKREIF